MRTQALVRYVLAVGIALHRNVRVCSVPKSGETSHTGDSTSGEPGKQTTKLYGSIFWVGVTCVCRYLCLFLFLFLLSLSQSPSLCPSVYSGLCVCVCVRGVNRVCNMACWALGSCHGCACLLVHSLGSATMGRWPVYVGVRVLCLRLCPCQYQCVCLSIGACLTDCRLIYRGAGGRAHGSNGQTRRANCGSCAGMCACGVCCVCVCVFCVCTGAGAARVFLAQA